MCVYTTNERIVSSFFPHFLAFFLPFYVFHANCFKSVMRVFGNFFFFFCGRRLLFSFLSFFFFRWNSNYSCASFGFFFIMYYFPKYSSAIPIRLMSVIRRWLHVISGYFSLSTFFFFFLFWFNMFFFHLKIPCFYTNSVCIDGLRILVNSLLHTTTTIFSFFVVVFSFLF